MHYWLSDSRTLCPTLGNGSSFLVTCVMDSLQPYTCGWDTLQSTSWSWCLSASSSLRHGGIPADGHWPMSPMCGLMQRTSQGLHPHNQWSPTCSWSLILSGCPSAGWSVHSGPPGKCIRLHQNMLGTKRAGPYTAGCHHMPDKGVCSTRGPSSSCTYRRRQWPHLTHHWWAPMVPSHFLGDWPHQE